MSRFDDTIRDSLLKVIDASSGGYAAYRDHPDLIVRGWIEAELARPPAEEARLFCERNELPWHEGMTPGDARRAYAGRLREEVHRYSAETGALLVSRAGKIEALADRLDQGLCQ